MSLGGGTFLVQNKILPGSYINFVSASRASATLSERGVAAMPLELSWGPDGEVFTVTADEFEKQSMKIFGYAYIADELKNLRELFRNIRKGHFFKLNTGGTKASCGFCTARYSGIRGDKVMIIIANNEEATEESQLYDVLTLFDGVLVDEQKGIAEMKDVSDNDYVIWKRDTPLALTANTPLTGGTDGTVLGAADQIFLDKIESYTFNTLGRATTNPILKSLYANFTKRMRDTVGVKFQCVLYRYAGDYEGIISVENKLTGEQGNEVDTAALVYWVTGAEAGCEVNATVGNRVYDGEYDVDAGYTQSQLEDALKSGKFIFHKVNDAIRVLSDVNTFVSVTDTKNADFSSNQTMRVLDQIGNDIAALFNSKYLDKVPNDAPGRMALWNDIERHHRELESIRAIEDFDSQALSVEKGNTKRSVVVTDYVTPVNAMAQLYMTVIVQ